MIVVTQCLSFENWLQLLQLAIFSELGGFCTLLYFWMRIQKWNCHERIISKANSDKSWINHSCIRFLLLTRNKCRPSEYFSILTAIAWQQISAPINKKKHNQWGLKTTVHRPQFCNFFAWLKLNSVTWLQKACCVDRYSAVAQWRMIPPPRTSLFIC